MQQYDDFFLRRYSRFKIQKDSPYSRNRGYRNKRYRINKLYDSDYYQDYYSLPPCYYYDSLTNGSESCACRENMQRQPSYCYNDYCPKTPKKFTPIRELLNKYDTKYRDRRPSRYKNRYRGLLNYQWGMGNNSSYQEYANRENNEERWILQAIEDRFLRRVDRIIGRYDEDTNEQDYIEEDRRLIDMYKDRYANTYNQAMEVIRKRIKNRYRKYGKYEFSDDF